MTDDGGSTLGRRRLGSCLPLSLAGVEYLERVQGAAHRGLQGERAGIELAAHAVTLQDPDAVLAGDRTVQGDRRVEELLERGLSRDAGRCVARRSDDQRVQV